MRLLSAVVFCASLASGLGFFAPSSFLNLRSRLNLRMSATNTAPNSAFDFDVAIVGCGVGGHAAALHARACGLRTAIFTGGDVGGTCVNRGCVPSKALLACAGRLREMGDAKHLAAFGISTGGVSYDRAAVSAHASQLARKVRENLAQSLAPKGVEVFPHFAELTSEEHKLKLVNSGDGGVSDRKEVSARNIILAPGSRPLVPRGICVDEQTVLTSDGALRLDFVPQHVAIVGSGYIGMEFADIYTALGSEVTLIEAMDSLMSSFDPDIRRLAERVLVKSRAVDFRTGVIASSVLPGQRPVGGSAGRPVVINLEPRDRAAQEAGAKSETLCVDACLVATGRKPDTTRLGLAHAGVLSCSRGFVRVDPLMRALRAPSSTSSATSSSSASPEVFEHLYCVGDANGVMMLAHAASAQAISVVENICSRSAPITHTHIPAACFTHPEIAMVGLSEEQAKAKAEKEGFTLGKGVSYFKANSKALAELEPDGLCKILFNRETGLLLGAHLMGLHAADLIQECANALALNSTVRELAMTTHAHPTLSEVMESAFRSCAGMNAH